MRKRTRFLMTAVLILALAMNASSAFAITSVYDFDTMAQYLELPGFSKLEEKVTLKVVAATAAPQSDVTPDTYDISNGMLNDIFLDRYNIELDWMWVVPSDQYDQKLTLSFASGDYPDVLMADAKTYKDLREADMLVELSELYETEVIEDIKTGIRDNKLEEQMFEEEGSLYYLPHGYVNNTSIAMIDYRSDWLETLGYEQFPQTLDELKAYLIDVATKDPDGNGEDDTYGLRGYSSAYGNYGFGGVFTGFGAYPGKWIEKDGEIVSGTIQPETLEALEYLAELYAAGAIDPEYATLTSDQVRERTVAGQYGVVMQDMYSQWESVRFNMNVDPTSMWGRSELVGKSVDESVKHCLNEKVISKYCVVIKNGKNEAEQLQAAKAMIRMYNQSCLEFITLSDKEQYPEFDFETSFANGYAHYWTPIYTDPLTLQWDLQNDCFKTWETGDTTYAGRQNRLNEYSWALAWYNATDEEKVNWTNTEYPERGTAWCQWDGFCPEGRAGLVLDTFDRGDYIYNVDHNGTTETEANVGSTISDYVQEYFHSFIMGQKDASSWDEFVSQWNTLGGDKITAEVNEGYNAIH